MTTLPMPNASGDVVLARPPSNRGPLSPHRHPDMGTRTASPRHAKAPERLAPEGGKFDIGTFDLACKFVEHLFAEQSKGAVPDGSSVGAAVDWEILAASAADAPSHEVALGRAIVAADRLARGCSSHVEVIEAAPSPSSTTDEPFFAFTLTDVEPDFGDDRYRSRVGRRIASVIGARHATVTPS